MLKDGVDGVDSLDGANSVTLSADGKHAYVTGQYDDAVSWYQINQIDGSMRTGLGNGEDYNVTLDDETHYIQVQASYVDGTGSRNWINSQPYYIRSTPLTTSTIITLSLVENLPIGSLVGEFNASDPNTIQTFPSISSPALAMETTPCLPSKQTVPTHRHHFRLRIQSHDLLHPGECQG